MQSNNIENLRKPGTFSSLGYGWERMKAHFLLFLLAELAIAVVGMPWGVNGSMAGGGAAGAIGVTGAAEGSPLLGALMTAYMLLFYSVVKYGSDLVFLRGVRGDDVNIKDIVKGFNNYLNVVLAALLASGLIGIATVVFIVPGIYVACRLAFVSYLVMDEGLDPIEAVEASWRLTKGHFWKIFRLGLISVLLFPLGMLCLFVGIFPAIMWAKASFAAMYLSITQEASD